MRIVTKKNAINVKGDIQYDNTDVSILSCIKKGLTSKQMSGIVFLSHRTVDKRVSNMQVALGAKSRAELVFKAIERGIV